MDTSFLKPHDILLYRGKGTLSQLIQWGTKSPYNHVAVILDPKIFLAVESNTGHQAGVRAIDLRKLEPEHIDVFRVKSELGFDLIKLNSFLISCLGSKYDFGGVVWLGILKFLSVLTGWTWKPYNRFQKDKDYFCSELCYEAFDQAGLDIVPQVDEANITSPGDIAASECLEKIKVNPTSHVQA